MKGYVEKALRESLNRVPSKAVYGPTKYNNQPEFGKKIQYAKKETLQPVNKKLKRKIHQVAEKLLYSGRVINSTTMEALNELNIKASQARKEIQELIEIFVDYLSTNPDTRTIFRASDMQLQIDSATVYLVHPKARSRVGGYHYLDNVVGIFFNGPIYILAKVIEAVMSSVANVECESLCQCIRCNAFYINTM